VAEEVRLMLEAKKYRQYAKDCVRIAACMSSKDRQTLLDIADAWEARAAEVESKGPKSDGGRDPSAPSVVPDAK
jgi:hypothetical protein